jgi:hypothetical protein
MSGNNNHTRKSLKLRAGPRIHSVTDICVNYEGRTEEVAIRPPDVSANGMFFNTASNFPVGAVLNLKFCLAVTGVEIRTRCEVRYCLPGVGVGVEFIGILPEAVLAIEREIELCTRPRSVKKASVVR